MKRMLIRYAVAALMFAGIMVLQGAAQCPTPMTSHPSGTTNDYRTARTALLWDEVPDAMYYQLWVVKDGAVFHREWFMGEQSWSADGPLPPGDYTYWVRTWNPCGFGDWSPTGFSFSVDCGYVQPPSPTEPNGAAYELEFDGDFVFWRGMPQATWFNIWIERDGAVQENRWLPYRYGYGYAFSHISAGNYKLGVDELGEPLPCGDYAWKLRSWSACNGTTDWSHEVPFTVNCCTSAPVQVELKVYDFWGSAVVDGGTVSDPRPGLDWSNFGDATWFNVSIQKDGRAFFNGWTRDTYWWSRSGDMPLGEYTARVRGWNECGFGAWSDAFSFTRTCTTLTAPDNTREHFGYGYHHGLLLDTVLAWSSPAGMYWQQLQVKRNGRTVFDRWLNPLNDGDPIEWGMQAWSSAFDRHGDYTWMVRGWNHCGTGPWSIEDSFSIDCELTKPSLVGPFGVIHTRRPDLVWERQDHDADMYRIYIQRNGKKYADLTIDESDDDLMITTASGAYIPGWDLPGGSYTWWLQMQSDCYGATRFSDGGSFTISAP